MVPCPKCNKPGWQRDVEGPAQFFCPSCGHEDYDTRWCQPMDAGKQVPRKFVVMFDDSELGISVFEDENEAYEFYEQANLNWNCYLLGVMPERNTR